jgi:cytoskeleton protein RodZ
MKAAPSEVVEQLPVNPGETLRQAREAQRLTKEQVARQLHLTVQVLGQLEEGAFDRLPGHTFSRGYIRTYAKLLGLDQNVLVAAFDRYTGTDAKGSDVHVLQQIKEPARPGQVFLRLMSVVILALLIVLGYVLWQRNSGHVEREHGNVLSTLERVEVESADGTTQIHDVDAPDDATAATTDTATTTATADASTQVTPTATAVAETAPTDAAAAVPTQAPGSAAPVVTPPESTAAATVAAAPAQSAVASVPSVAPAQAPAAAETASNAPKPADAAAAAPAVAAAGEGSIGLLFKERCWVQIKDATGRVLVSEVKNKGDSLNMAVKVPAELRLGVSHGADVTFNGAPVDVTPFISRETVRMTLGQ